MRQPVHVVYGGGHLFKHDIAARFSRIALKALDEHSSVLPVRPEIIDRVRDKLTREPIEDYRIDFEDGYGWRSNDEEDAHVRGAAEQVLAGLDAGTMPAGLGLRVKPFTPKNRARALRSLDLFFEALQGEIPENFVVCLPKVSRPEEIEDARNAMLAWGESIAIEFLVETAEALLRVRELVDACQGHCRGVHFGPYDFTAGCGIVANMQRLRHPLCDHARNTILVALSGTGIWLSDGPTAVLPTGSAADVEKAWLRQMSDIRHALSCGYYQGWDLHPAQLPARYAAVYSFFHESADAIGERLRNFREASAQATRVGAAFDDAATGRALQGFFMRGFDCGAFTEADLQRHTGLAPDALRELQF